VAGNGSVFITCIEEKKGLGLGAASFIGRRMIDGASSTTRETCSWWRGGTDVCLKLQGRHPPLPVSGDIQISIACRTRHNLASLLLADRLSGNSRIAHVLSPVGQGVSCGDRCHPIIPRSQAVDPTRLVRVIVEALSPFVVGDTAWQLPSTDYYETWRTDNRILVLCSRIFTVTTGLALYCRSGAKKHHLVAHLSLNQSLHTVPHSPDTPRDTIDKVLSIAR